MLVGMRLPFLSRKPKPFPLTAGADAGTPGQITPVPAFDNEDDERAYTDAFCDLMSSDDPDVLAKARETLSRLGVETVNVGG